MVLNTHNRSDYYLVWGQEGWWGRETASVEWGGGCRVDVVHTDVEQKQFPRAMCTLTLYAGGRPC